MISHPRPNRVTPFGEFEATSAKGMFLGNRGDIHAADGNLGHRRWALKAWICCTLSPKSGNRIEFDRKGTYYPLFFVDEATAFAAGHRPCAQCRYQDYQRFKRSWQSARGMIGDRFLPAAEIDRDLHVARVDASRRKIVHESTMGELPDGAMAAFRDSPTVPRLVWCGKTYRWSQSGYSHPEDVVADRIVDVLTPAPLIDVLRAGYELVVHDSAQRD